jgi:hypothetical protein
MLLVFLIVSLKVAEQAGVYGASAVTGWAQKGVYAPFGVFKLAGKGVKAAAGYSVEKVHERTGVQLNPKKWLEGWHHSREENQAKREALGKAKALSRQGEIASALGDPTSFFQRYWNPHAIKRLMQGGDKRGKELLKEAQALKVAFQDNKKNMSQEQKDQALKDYQTKMDMAMRLFAPVNYHTQKELRGKMDEEKNKIHTKNWNELYSLFQTALEEKEVFRAGGILKKVTETYNENEFINSSHYMHDMKARDSSEWKDEETREILIAKGIKEDDVLHEKGENFTYSRHGVENFRNQILEHELGLGEQVSMQLMSDVSDIAEDKNHRVIMRMYGSDESGKMYFKPTKEVEPEVRAENNKLSAEAMINNCNRLAGYIEVPDRDYDLTGNRKAQVTAPQIAYYIEHASDIEPLIRRGRVNTSQAKAFAENSEEILAVSEQIMEDGPMAHPVTGMSTTKKAIFKEAMEAVGDKGRTLTADVTGLTTIDKTIEAVRKLNVKEGKGM